MNKETLTEVKKMVKLTVDGKSVEVPVGTRLIDAARMTEQDVPYYCYHPGLSVAGNCRMCQVEIEGMPHDLGFRLSVTDSNGSIVVDSKHNNSPGTFKTILDLTGQPKGIYLLRIMTGSEMTTAKIILQ